jgi:CHAT domain-containing protein/tetratricopeptide (TPR) repeat protein
MKRLLCATWIIVCAGLAHAQDDALAPDSKALLRLSGSESRSWRLAIPAASTVQVKVVEQQGLAGVLLAVAADGRELAEAYLSERTELAKTLLVPPEGAWLRIDAENHSSIQRVFELQVGTARSVGEQDRLRFQAEQLLGDGERLFREQKEGYVDSSLALEEKALRLWKQISDPAHEATVYLHLAAIREFKRDIQAALDDCQKALGLWEGLHDRSGMADALNEIATLEKLREQPAKAREFVARALELARESGDSRNVARALLTEADLDDRGGKADQARAEYLEALPLVRSNGNRLAEADTLGYLATFEHDHGRFQASADYAVQALTISREEADRTRTATCLVRLSNVYATMGDLRKAISYGEEALPLLKNPAAPYKYSNALYNVGQYYQAIDDYSTALKDFNEALENFRSVGSVLGQAFTQNGLGYVHLRLGDEAKADTYYREAARLFHNASQKQAEAFALMALGGIASRRGELAKAIELDRQAVNIARDGQFTRVEELSLGDLAEAHFLAHDYKASADDDTQMIDVIHKAGFAQEEQEGNALRRQGRALRLLREYPEARKALKKALDLYQTAGIRALTAATLYELAALDRDEGLLPQAITEVSQSLDLLEAVGADAGNAETRMSFAASHRKTFDLAVDLAMRTHQDAKAFEWSESARARAFVDLIRGARLDVREGVDAGLLEKERRIQESLNQSHERLTRLLAAVHTDASAARAKREVDDLVEKYEDVEGEIRRTSPRYAALVEPHSLSARDIQASLPDSHTAILEYWLGSERSYAWLVTRTDCRGFELSAGDKIEALVRRAYSALTARNLIQEESLEQRNQRIRAADESFVHDSAELSHILLGPLQGISGVRRLWIVSDGALEYLPFAALTAPGSAQPLVPSSELAQLASASALAEVRRQIAGRAQAPRRVAVFADPVFTADDERVINPGGSASSVQQQPELTRAAEDAGLANLPRLRFSRREADAIAALDPRSATWEALDFNANHAQAQSPALASYRVVHFATHAILDSHHPELSGLVLSLVDSTGHPRNGFLRLHEIYNLKLNADLVVLSGCETALGQEVRSEGLVGLTRGFMYAGVPQVMASLWSVRDQATAELMKSFYEPLLRKNAAPDEALRAAQLAMMKDTRWRQPYYWAAFTIQGVR